MMRRSHEGGVCLFFRLEAVWGCPMSENRFASKWARSIGVVEISQGPSRLHVNYGSVCVPRTAVVVSNTNRRACGCGRAASAPCVPNAMCHLCCLVNCPSATLLARRWFRSQDIFSRDALALAHARGHSECAEFLKAGALWRPCAVGRSSEGMCRNISGRPDAEVVGGGQRGRRRRGAGCKGKAEEDWEPESM